MNFEEYYSKIYDWENLVLAWKKARKGKTKKDYVKEFEENLFNNLKDLQFELMSLTYQPKPLINFVLRDPKTRVISKSDFRDRVVHHALINVIQPIFEKSFFIDSCANQVGKGTLFALKRFDLFKGRVTENLNCEAFCLKADIKHYFQEVNHQILLEILDRKIKDEKVIWLIKQILNHQERERERERERGARYDTRISRSDLKGMPLGNLTSQFFANVYLNELDYFVKHKLKAKYYVRYVDDFVILYSSKEQIDIWKRKIQEFLESKLKLKLHPDKSRIINLSKGVDFIGFRNFYYFRLLRKRNIRKIIFKIEKYKNGEISKEKILKSFQGWNAYAKWANTLKLRREVVKKIYKISKTINYSAPPSLPPESTSPESDSSSSGVSIISFIEPLS